MSAMPIKQMRAFAQPSRQIKAINTSSRTPPARSIASKHDHWTMKFTLNARGHNPNYADVPIRVAFDDCKMFRRLEPTAHRRDTFQRDRFFGFLAFAIGLIERR